MNIKKLLYNFLKNYTLHTDVNTMYDQTGEGIHEYTLKLVNIISKDPNVLLTLRHTVKREKYFYYYNNLKTTHIVLHMVQSNNINLIMYVLSNKVDLSYTETQLPIKGSYMLNNILGMHIKPRSLLYYLLHNKRLATSLDLYFSKEVFNIHLLYGNNWSVSTIIKKYILSYYSKYSYVSKEIDRVLSTLTNLGVCLKECSYRVDGKRVSLIGLVIKSREFKKYKDMNDGTVLYDEDVRVLLESLLEYGCEYDSVDSQYMVSVGIDMVRYTLQEDDIYGIL